MGDATVAPREIPAVAAAVPLRRRALIALGCGFLAGLHAFFTSRSTPIPRDFGQVWFAARALLHGQDPYTLIGPGRAFEWAAPFFYPLPAAIVATPVAPFSAFWAPILFAAIGGACFAWALQSHGTAPLLGLLSAPVLFAASQAQWSPLLAASTVIAPLAIIQVAKPTIGFAMFVARPTWWAAIGGLALVALSFALQPHWLTGWRSALATQQEAHRFVFPYLAPVRLPGGAFALLALLRWRRPEARLIAALACVPQTPMLYEAVPLFLVPRTFGETALLVVLSYVAFAMAALGLGAEHWPWIVLLYLPATVMVLRRPNVGPLPAWVEERIARWPAWLRGGP